MSDLRHLYQEVILDHNKRPRNFREMESCSHHASGHNPLCGDQVDVYVEVEDGKVKDLSFKGNGCAISTASASMMTEAVKGKPIEEVEALFQDFHSLITGNDSGKNLGKLRILSGVKDYPSRVKCATLVWHTLRAALDNKDETVVTE